MLTNPCFYVFGDAFRILHFYCTHFQAIFLFNKIFYQQTFNTILKLTGAYILSLKAKKSAADKDYMLISDQLVSFDDFKVLASSNSEFHLKIKESLLMSRDQTVLNNIEASLLLHLLD